MIELLNEIKEELKELQKANAKDFFIELEKGNGKEKVIQAKDIIYTELISVLDKQIEEYESERALEDL